MVSTESWCSGGEGWGPVERKEEKEGREIGKEKGQKAREM